MQDQPINSQNSVDAAKGRVDNLLVSLRFVDACFNCLPYPKAGKRSFSITYYCSETLEFGGLGEIITVLKRSINYQVESGKEISIPADINLRQKMIVEQQELELFYYGNLSLHDTAGWVYYCWYQSTPTVSIDLREKTTGEMILSLFSNLKEAISDQI